MKSKVQGVSRRVKERNVVLLGKWLWRFGNE